MHDKLNTIWASRARGPLQPLRIWLLIKSPNLFCFFAARENEPSKCTREMHMLTLTLRLLFNSRLSLLRLFFLLDVDGITARDVG